MSKPARRIALLFTTVLIALAVTRVPFMVAGADVHLSLFSDDASYYLEATRRTAETGAWPSMDGERPTNGFHPIYFGILLAIQILVGTEPVRVVPLVFALNLLLGVLAVLGLVWVFRARLASRAGAAVAVMLAISPGWLAHGLAGVENGLSSLAALLVVLRFVARFDSLDELRFLAPKGPREGWIADGLLLGLAMAARTDAVVLAAAYLLSAFVLRSRRERLRCVSSDLVRCGIAATAPVLPWLGVNLWRFGTISQDSAVALAARFARTEGAFGSPAWLAHLAKNVAFWLYRLGWSWGLIPLTFFLLAYALPTSRLRTMPARASGAALLALCLSALLISHNDPWYIASVPWAGVELSLGALAFGLGLVTPRSRGLFAPSTVAFTLAWVGALLFVFSVGLGAFQLWYTTAPTLAAIFLLTLPALVALLEGRSFLAGALVCLVATQAAIRVDRYLAQGAFDVISPRLLAGGAALRERLEGVAATQPFRVGSFDSGELAYSVHPFPVVNLDGVMNHGAAQAIVGNRLADYLRNERLTHVIAEEERLRYFQQVSPFVAHADPALSERLGVTVFSLGEP